MNRKIKVFFRKGGLLLVPPLLFLILFRVDVRERLEVLYVHPKEPEDVRSVECSSVAPVVYKRVPCLAKLDAKKKKQIFINLILPAVLIENYRVKKLRERLLKIKQRLDSGSLTEEEKAFLEDLCRRYKATTIEELLYKIDVIPAGLVIAQAALESGWGSSRFFCKANNVFGEWSFSKKSAGIKAKESEVYLKKFDTLLDAVDSYFYNLNVGWAYEGFRLARLRDKNSLSLIEHLVHYSILGKEYVKRLKKLIVANNLTSYDECELDKSYIKRTYRIVFRFKGLF